MVLTDREIQAVLQSGQIIVEPAPAEDAYGPTNLDLKLSNKIRVWKEVKARGVDQSVCPAAAGYSYNDFAQEFSDPHEIGSDGYVLEPGCFVLGWTAENIELPTYARLAARVEGKSSLARLGIGVHVTAPTIQAGFRGQIQLEFCNHGTLRVKIVPGMPVCQIIFEQTLGTAQKGYKGQFLDQKPV
jgi:dCTP deaminase